MRLHSRTNILQYDQHPRLAPGALHSGRSFFVVVAEHDGPEMTVIVRLVESQGVIGDPRSILR